MSAEAVYDWLMHGSEASECDAFDRHVIAAIFSLAFADAEADKRNPLEGLGLTKAGLLDLARMFFPAAVEELDRTVPDLASEVDAEEQSLRDILAMYSSEAGLLQQDLCVLIARRCKAPHHLWQDLGFRERGELSELMRRHFAPLAAKNRNDMKWKKFLYRMVCGAEGFTLCTAPVCSECEDFANCFGAEDGESRLAWARNAPDGTRLRAAE